MTNTARKRRIISNDDGWIVTNNFSLATPERIKELMIDTYEGTPIDAVSWCVGDHEVYDYETEVGERFGTGYTHFEDERDQWSCKNLNHLIEVAGGPVSEIGRQVRAAGMDFFPSVRMNSHYEIAYASPRYGEFRRRHPECLIGQPDEYIPAPTIEHAIRTGLDYKYPLVRQHMLGIICELCERFEVDGIELDYMRHPAFFRPEEAYSCRYLMTDFIRQIRRHMDQVGSARGRRIELLVRVPPTLYDSARIGLDVRSWIEEGLVDIVAAGGGFMPFEMPLREFVEAARDKDCQIYGSLEALRWALDEEVLRALAARCWDAGVDGLYLFNYFNTPNEWKRRVLGEMVERQRLSRLDKRYELDHTDRIESKSAHVGAFRYAIPHASLPLFMEETTAAGGAVLRLQVADDVEAAHGAGTLAACSLYLGFENLAEEDVLEVSCNGQDLEWGSRCRSEAGWSYLVFDGKIYHTTMSAETVPGTMIQFPLGPMLVRRGENRLQIRLVKGEAPRFAPVVLREVRLEINYQ